MIHVADSSPGMDLFKPEGRAVKSCQITHIFRFATIGRLNVYTDNRWQP